MKVASAIAISVRSRRCSGGGGGALPRRLQQVLQRVHRDMAAFAQRQPGTEVGDPDHLDLRQLLDPDDRMVEDIAADDVGEDQHRHRRHQRDDQRLVGPRAARRQPLQAGVRSARRSPHVGGRRRGRRHRRCWRAGGLAGWAGMHHHRGADRI